MKECMTDRMIDSRIDRRECGDIERVAQSNRKRGASQSYLQVNERIPVMLAKDDRVSGCEVES